MPLDERMDLRIATKAKLDFVTKCIEHGREPASVLREIIDAFNEKRLTITVSKTNPTKPLEIYNHVNRK